MIFLRNRTLLGTSSPPVSASSSSASKPGPSSSLTSVDTKNPEKLKMVEKISEDLPEDLPEDLQAFRISAAFSGAAKRHLQLQLSTDSVACDWVSHSSSARATKLSVRRPRRLHELNQA